MDRDESLRIACFLALDALRARFGDDVPWSRSGEGLGQGFVFEGRRVAFGSQPGIYRARQQRGPAALTIKTSIDDPYGDLDHRTEDGLWYAYQSGPMDNHHNQALLAAYALGVPVAYFEATAKACYHVEYPCYVIDNDQHARRVRVVVGHRPDGVIPQLADDPIERRYAERLVLTRLHQAHFRRRVLNAYSARCAVCSLREQRLLDGAHIVEDRREGGIAAVRNGLSLCTIHHRAFDSDLVGVSPDYEVRVAQRLRDDIDGPMLDLLKRAHGSLIRLPRPHLRPDRELLAERYDRFRERDVTTR